jgi:hypothetical protein
MTFGSLGLGVIGRGRTLVVCIYDISQYLGPKEEWDLLSPH